MRSPRVSAVLGMTLAAALAFASAAAHAAGGVQAHKPNPLADPPANTAPSQATYQACFAVPQPKASDHACDLAALKDFDAVRKREGLAPMVLPAGFDTMSVPFALLTITNIERVDRGLIPVKGLSSRLNQLAQTGADHDTDPAFPNPWDGSSGGGAWAAAGNSPLIADFAWMYDDGLDSGNLDCVSGGDTSGCWGHRHAIISQAYTASLVAGAAVTYGTADGTSMTEEFVGADNTDKVDVTPTWAMIAKTMPLELSASRLSVVSHNKKVHSAVLTVRSYSASTVKLAVAAGSRYWSVSPKSCHLAAGKTCTLHMHFRSTKPGRHVGVLRLTGAAGRQSVRLIGRRVAH